MTIEQVLEQCSIEDNVLKLPEHQLDRKVYLELKKSLEKIGGKWKGGKIFGFVFEDDPSEEIEALKRGEKLDPKKEFQFFETPTELACLMAKELELNKNDYVLEPSAGKGSLLKEALKYNLEFPVDYYEAMPKNVKFLKENYPKHKFLGLDFLKGKTDKKYDKIIANPPFSKNQDIDHLLRMVENLKTGGKIVCVMSNHWTFAQDKKSKHFRNWLEQQDYKKIDLDSGTFKTSGTMVRSVLLIINN